jgi:CMP-2-keto-3-deoxyoctulosonic acid synthetase
VYQASLGDTNEDVAQVEWVEDVRVVDDTERHGVTFSRTTVAYE